MRRNAIDAAVETDRGELHCWATHLDIYCRPEYRLHQAAPVLDAVRQQSSVIMGLDANTICSRITPSSEILLRGFASAKLIDTAPARASSWKKVDFILAKGMGERRGLEYPESTVSDHPLLVASFFRNTP